MGITIFEVIGKISIKDIQTNLRNIKPIKTHVSTPQGDLKELITTIEVDEHENDYVSGVITQDYLDKWYDRNKKQQSMVKVRFTNFTFRKGSLHLLIHTAFDPASKISTILGNAVFKDKDSPIITMRLDSEKTISFLNEHKCEIKGCSWLDLDLPNLSKAHIIGFSIDNTAEFKKYEEHGTKNNIFFRMPDKEVTLSLSRTATVSIRNKMEIRDQEQFILDNIIPLCN